MKTIASIACVLALSACAQVPPERQVVNDAATALGGVDRIQAVKTLVIEGEGAAPNVGQNTMPDGELPVWKVTEFRRAIDVPNHRMRTTQTRTAQLGDERSFAPTHQGVGVAPITVIHRASDKPRTRDYGSAAGRISHR